MTHHPDVAALLTAVDHALRDDGLADLTDSRRHELRVARTALAWVRREIAEPPARLSPARAAELVTEIRRGDHDDPEARTELARRLREPVRGQLRVVRPEWLDEEPPS